MKALILSILLGVYCAPSITFVAPSTCEKVVISDGTNRTELKAGEKFDFKKDTYYFVDIVTSGNVQMLEFSNNKLVDLWN